MVDDGKDIQEYTISYAQTFLDWPQDTCVNWMILKLFNSATILHTIYVEDIVVDLYES